jgi:hypothetical protein
MSGADAAHERQMLPDNEETKEPGFDFELHYGLSCKSVRDVLREILEDMSSYKHIHNWDEKLLTSPLKALARVGRRYLNANPLDLNALLDHSMVEEILTVSGVNHRPPAMQQAGDIYSHLFSTKVGSRSYDQF